VDELPPAETGACNAATINNEKQTINTDADFMALLLERDVGGLKPEVAKA
jgi:hypothetical protein